MTQPSFEVNFGGDQYREGIEVRKPSGAWVVTGWWPVGARGGPHELHIAPAPNADPLTIARGISTATLNALPLVEMTAEVAQAAPAAEAAAEAIASMSSEANRLRNRSPLFYAQIAAQYAALTAAGERQPIQLIARHWDRSTEAVRGWVRTARKMGYLTGEAGRTTGALTEEAKQLLGQIDPFKLHTNDEGGE
jgi:hypothetical protein